MAETSRERIAKRRRALSTVDTALNYVRDGLAMQQPIGQASREPIGQASREDWLRVLDTAREQLAQLEQDAAEDLRRAERRRR